MANNIRERIAEAVEMATQYGSKPALIVGDTFLKMLSNCMKEDQAPIILGLPVYHDPTVPEGCFYVCNISKLLSIPGIIPIPEINPKSKGDAE